MPGQSAVQWQNSFKIVQCNILLTQSRTTLGSVVAISLTQTNKNQWENHGNCNPMKVALLAFLSSSPPRHPNLICQLWFSYSKLDKYIWTYNVEKYHDQTKAFYNEFKALYIYFAIILHKSTCTVDKELHKINYSSLPFPPTGL